MTDRRYFTGTPEDAARWLRDLGEPWMLERIGLSRRTLQQLKTKALKVGPAKNALPFVDTEVPIVCDPTIGDEDVFLVAKQGMTRDEMRAVADAIAAMMRPSVEPST